MKPFDLKAALAGAKVVTRDGRPVKIAGYNEYALPRYRILLWDADRVCRCATEYGQVGDADQLFMAPTEKKEWVVIYTNVGKQYCLGDVFESPDLAHKAAGNMGAYYMPTVHEITIIE